jgi:hypothetical protein
VFEVVADELVEIEGLKYTKEQAAAIKKIQEDGRQKLDAAITEAKALKAKSDLTVEQRADLDKRLEALQTEVVTKEELARQERENLLKEHKKAVDTLVAERDSWRNNFTHKTIERDILDAVSKPPYKFRTPEHAIALLKDHTELEEVMDGEKHTGEFVTKVNFRTRDKENKPTVLKLTVAEAVKQMFDMPEHEHLFEPSGTGGQGSFNRASGGNQSLADIAKTMSGEAYITARNTGKISIEGEQR